MALLPLVRMWERIERSRDDGDTALLLELLYGGELLLKLIVAGFVSAVLDDRERHRYRQLHRLVRADGLGEWPLVLDETLTGPTSQHLAAGARDAQKQLTERVTSGDWRYEAVALAQDCLQILGPKSVEDLPTKTDGRRWFGLFAALRNRTRGHGAPSAAVAGEVCRRLESSLHLVEDRLLLLQWEWAYLHRNLSGKYRVTPLTETAKAFSNLKSSADVRLTDGVYVSLGEPLRVDLVYSNSETTDFFLPNGNFTAKRFELFSYVSGHTEDGDAAPYLNPATALPESETEGLKALGIYGQCFANLPQCPPDYVKRPGLERELMQLISDDRHPIVTLAGRGGIGKTSVALSVLHEITGTSRFSVIVWLSARDIDLLPIGPKPVKPQVLTTLDMARDVVALLEPAEAVSKGFKPTDYFAQLLTKCDLGPMLIVLDNFETVRVPQETFVWLDTFVRPPNKVLITTRTRDFKGDYPVEMSGMTEEECEILVETTSSRLGIAALISSAYRRELYRETEGHPYVVKILLGEVANAGRALKVERIVATKDEVLTALFERTYAGLSPAAKRVFLTMCGWRSLVPQIALEAVLLRKENEKLDVDASIQELTRASLVEQYRNEAERLMFLGVPLTAALFGRRKLAVSPMSPEIEADLELLHTFGPTQRTDLAATSGNKIEKLFSQISERIGVAGETLDRYVPILEFLARRYPNGWLWLAKLHEEARGPDWIEKAKGAVRKHLEGTPRCIEQIGAWRKLAWLCECSQDVAGEAHSLVELARIGGVSFGVISGAANRLNGLFSGQSSLEAPAKRVMATRVVQLMESRISEANATDMSRLAWLYLHLKNEEQARTYTRLGMEAQPGNVHINNLAERLGMVPSDA